MPPMPGTDAARPRTDEIGVHAAATEVLALDIGGTKLATAVVGADGAVRGLQRGPTLREEGPERVLARMAALAEESLQQAATSGHDQVCAVGITSGGPLDPETGVVHRPNHLPDWDGIGLTDWATERFGLPAVLDNDATAAALAEQRWGAGRGIESLLYLTLSTGIGGGMVIDGRPFRGATGNGGEPGHIVVVPDGRSCSCGRRGCLEAYCSGTSIAARTQELDAQRPGEGGALIDAAQSAARARAGDPIARQVWDETAHLLARGIVDLANVWDPQLIVLGGGVSGSADLLLTPVRHAVANEAMEPTAQSCQVRATELGELTALLGAAAIALLHLDRPTGVS